MEIGLFLAILLLLFLVFMVRQAFENNIRQHEIVREGINEEFKVFFISDVHNRWIDEKMLATLNKIDVIIIGGDFVDKRTSEMKIEGNLKRLQAIAPIYFVWGNNDREIDEKKLTKLFQKYEVTVLCNNSIKLSNMENPVRLCAVDFHCKESNIKSAIEEVEEQDSVLFIAHNPQIFSKIRDELKPALLMGGHLHGGQIRFGRLGMYMNGSFKERKGIPTLISNGYGTTFIPLRFGAKPECHVIHIRFGKN